ncbi:MAG: histidine kinase [Flavisolibacter sp.]|nr:histidine kinase [Flavisolibacter sp.]
MIKDYPLRIITILLGVVLFYYYSTYTLRDSSIATLFLSGSYFLVSSFVVTEGALRIIHLLRNKLYYFENVYSRILLITFITLLFFVTIVGISYALWSTLVKRPLDWNLLVTLLKTWLVVGVIFILLYEVLILYKEKEIDKKVLHQLDKERSLAEVSVLKNSLEPHFLFNTLNALSYLILSNPEKAHTFNTKLTQVFKYLLVNKDKDLVAFEDELEFIENYFYLLQIRFENMIQMNVDIKPEPGSNVFIVPGALQTLIENAIKHNEFSSSAPLTISITLSHQFIYVANDLRPKATIETSTNTGLRHLKERYIIICNKRILVKRSDHKFIVKLPIIKTQ